MNRSKRKSLRILVAESHVGAAGPAVNELRRRGHDVVSCAPPPGSSAPCVGLSPDGSCPLDEPVDVVVDVHTDASARIQMGELPAVCAMRREVPVIAVGPPDMTATITWASRRCTIADAPDACEEIGRICQTRDIR